jgi:hypothetical protein
MIADPEFLGLSKAYRRAAHVRFGSTAAFVTYRLPRLT